MNDAINDGFALVEFVVLGKKKCLKNIFHYLVLQVFLRVIDFRKITDKAEI